MPKKITIDDSSANHPTIKEVNKEIETPIIIRQVKYLNNIVEQNQRLIKRITEPMMGVKSFNNAGFYTH